MVYRGPSTGCQRCRQRHIKCDEVRPACRRCTAIGESCPGFPGVDGVVFKDVTHSVIERQTRRNNPVRGIYRTTYVPAKPKPNITPSRASLSVDFFFLNHVLTTERDPTTSLGHFDYIIPLYQGCTPFSVLNLAVSLMSTCALCLHLGEAPDTRWYLQTEQAACQALQSAIVDPYESMQDKTLLAVLCLNYADQLYSRSHGKACSRAHVAGAIALAQHRGPARFDNQVSQSLLNATRANAVLQSLWFTDDHSQDAVLSLPTIEPAEANPAVNLHYILAQVLVLERQCIKERQEALIETRPANLKPLNDLANQFMHDTDRWYGGACKTWQISPCLKPPDAAFMPSSPSGYNAFPSMRIAYVMGQWCCVKLMVLKYISITADKGISSCDILTHADEVLQILFVILTYVHEAEHQNQQSLSVFQECTSRNGATVRPERKSGHVRAARNRRLYLFNLLRWLDAIFEEDEYGTEVLRVIDQTLLQLSNLSSQVRSMSAEHIGYLDP